MSSSNKRLLRDINDMSSKEINDLGIYYHYDDFDITKGTGLLFGPEGTPYADIPLVFSVTIPADYPFNSPSVTIVTSDGATRFHPNLYVTGKVCLSILGTYSGPKWVSTMNIATVFKSILSILNENPIVNEPSWERHTLDHPLAKDYAEWVEFNLLKHVVHEYRNFKSGGQQSTIWEPFREVFDAMWPARWARILERIQTRATRGVIQYTRVPYGMSGEADWPRLKAETDALAP